MAIAKVSVLPVIWLQKLSCMHPAMLQPLYNGVVVVGLEKTGIQMQNNEYWLLDLSSVVSPRL